MPHNLRFFLLITLVLAGLLLAWGLGAAAPGAAAPSSLPTPTALPLQPPPGLPPAPHAPDISFIDSPTAACQVLRGGGCAITWNYLYANAAPGYVISMTVVIDNKLRGHYGGFFQTNMYVPSEMLAFRVDCGLYGASGVPRMGKTHAYALRVRASDGLSSANYGSVLCPLDKPYRYFLPTLRHK